MTATGNHPTEKLKPSVPTVFTHINRGRPDQSVLYLSHNPLRVAPESLFRQCGGFIKRKLGMVETSSIQMPDAIPKWLLRKDIDPNDEFLINPVSMTPEEFTRQHGTHPGHAIIWHAKRVPPPARPPLTLRQRLLPWTRPKLTAEEKRERKLLD